MGNLNIVLDTTDMLDGEEVWVYGIGLITAGANFVRVENTIVPTQWLATGDWAAQVRMSSGGTLTSKVFMASQNTATEPVFLVNGMIVNATIDGSTKLVNASVTSAKMAALIGLESAFR